MKSNLSMIKSVRFFSQGFHISKHLSDTQQSEMRAYMALVENVLVNAEVINIMLDY